MRFSYVILHSSCYRHRGFDHCWQKHLTHSPTVQLAPLRAINTRHPVYEKLTVWPRKRSLKSRSCKPEYPQSRLVGLFPLRVYPEQRFGQYPIPGCASSKSIGRRSQASLHGRRILLRSGVWTPYQRSPLTYSVCIVKNHGIPEESIKAVISASQRFFSLPEAEKLKVLVAFIFQFLVMFGDFLIRIGAGFSA